RRHQKTIAQLQKIIPDEMNRSLARGPLSPWGEGQYGYYFSPGTSLPPGVTVNTTINPSPNLDFSFPVQASPNRLLGATRKALDTSALPDLGLMVLPSPQGVAFSPDGRSILTDGTSNTILLWDAVNGEPFLWDDSGRTVKLGQIQGIDPRLLQQAIDAVQDRDRSARMDDLVQNPGFPSRRASGSMGLPASVYEAPVFRAPLLYARPQYTGDDRQVVFNLLAYAPGLHTNRTDILATLE